MVQTQTTNGHTKAAGIKHLIPQTQSPISSYSISPGEVAPAEVSVSPPSPEPPAEKPTPPGKSPGSSKLSFLKKLGFRSQMSLLLLGSLAVAVIGVTESLITLSENHLNESLRKQVEADMSELNLILDATTASHRAVVSALGSTLEAQGIDLSNAEQVQGQQALLNSLVVGDRDGQVDNPLGTSFLFILDAQGNTVAQNIQILDADFSTSPPPPPVEAPYFQTPTYRPVSIPAGIPFNVPIVESAIAANTLLSGVELLPGEALQRIGLDQQAAIGILPQPTEGLTEAERPVPEGTFNIDQGRMGLLIMAAHPVEIEGRTVGATVAGTLLNQNFGAVDRLREVTDGVSSSIFAQDWRISSSLPTRDGQSRSIGTRMASQVSASVLQEGEVFLDYANVAGETFLAGYTPVYDHRFQLNPDTAQPVGGLAAGQSAAEVEQALWQSSFTGYAVGGGILLLGGALILPLSAAFARPLRRLDQAAKEVAEGNLNVHVEPEGAKETQTLAQSFNELVTQTRHFLKQQELAAQERLQAQAQSELAKQQEENARQQQAAKEFLQNRALELLMEVAPLRQGDLTIRANVTEDEIGTIADSYNATISSLRQLVTQVQGAASQVASTTDTNQDAVQELAQEALNQSESIQSALDRIEQMNQSIQVVAQNAKQAEQAVQQAGQVVTQGDQAMNRTVEGILAIRETVAETAKKVKQLGESSQRISKVVNLIGSFAAQTNLLALNASIEAARAGEEGRGFAVVADEVRTLARQSAQATAEIEQLVAGIQAETNEVVAAMESGTEQVVVGTQLVEETRQSLMQIAQASQDITLLVQSIAESASTQSAASTEVADTINGVAGIATHTSGRANQVLDSFQDLVKVAQELQNTVGKFKLS